MPWAFGLSFDLDQSQPMLRGTVFTDRGVYRLGEEVRLKAILRHNTPQGIRLLPAGHACCFPCATDRIGSSPKERSPSTRGAAPSGRSRCRPRQPGRYSIRAILENDKPVPKKPEDLKPGDEPGPALDDEVAYEKAVHASFLVAAVSTAGLPRRREIDDRRGEGGRSGEGCGQREYLFGAPMPARPTTWTWTRSPGGSAPRAVYDALPDGDRWDFVGSVERTADTSSVMSRETKTSRTGELHLDLTDSTPASRTSTRSRRTSRTYPVSTSRTAPASRSIPRTGTSACVVRTISSIGRLVSRPS